MSKLGSITVVTFVLVAVAWMAAPAMCQVSVQPSAHDFGAVELGEEKSITMAITSVLPISVSEVELSGSAYFSMVAVSPDITLPPGGSVEVEITYKPLEPGEHTANLSVEGKILFPPFGSLNVSAKLAGEGVELQPRTIDASIDLDPDTLNLKSKGKWVTCYIIELSGGYDVSGINVDTIFLEGDIEVERSDVQDGVLMVKFSRQELIERLNGNTGDVTLTVKGEMSETGESFEGSDTIKVKNPGKGKLAPAKQRRVDPQGKSSIAWGKMKAK